MKKERPFGRAGFQEDGTYIKKVEVQIEGQWLAAKPGQTIITCSGPFLVEKVLDNWVFDNGRRYFRASGKVVDKKEKMIE